VTTRVASTLLELEESKRLEALLALTAASVKVSALSTDEELFDA